MKIIDKINNAIAEDGVFYSFEYFPPKTQNGVRNLYDRIDRMNQLGPLFVDITWGAGGSTSDLTLEISITSQNIVGIETMVHMTCTNMPKDKLRNAINTLKDNGIENILALRGDPPQNSTQWEAVEGGFEHSTDLVRYIRELHGDHFGITVAGYPEGHPESDSYYDDLYYLKEKVDAGGDVVITQLFYDCDIFLKFVDDCKSKGINCPIIPGIMPIHTYNGFKRMTTFCKTQVPKHILEDLEPIKDDDEEVKAYGVKLCVTMCRYLMNHGVRGLHFYTLNLEKSVAKILEGLELSSEPIYKSLPWKTTPHVRRTQEDVRPIFWSNRPKSYMARTMTWDDFPNGRWGDSASPAFGELSDYHLFTLHYPKGDNKKRWGRELHSLADVYRVFEKFCQGEVKALPWYEKPLESETKMIDDAILKLNQNGFLTINSQPRVNGAPSNDPIVGWGGPGGYVYQKAYIEMFVSPERLRLLLQHLQGKATMTYHAVNIKGDSYTNNRYPTEAVTWGVFPGKEIIQPTVVDSESFLVWKDEAFTLWNTAWASLYPEGSESRSIIDYIHDNFYLVNIVDSDFVNGQLFTVLNEIVAQTQEQGLE
eukprot:gb/GECH01009788.1/.p1 GENE.gb/GECH01009788.1/~~gb/GECH01009788.1/.p1  ORF type:complete len:593 (+),score=137.16 gb/GECH01009788.1/:1-1779(+)